MIPSYNAVSDAGLADDRDTGFRQSCDVPINSPDTGGKLICNILGPGHPAPLKINQDSDKSVDAIHSTYLNFFFSLDESGPHQIARQNSGHLRG
jgi:hypothetical protein